MIRTSEGQSCNTPSRELTPPTLTLPEKCVLLLHENTENMGSFECVRCHHRRPLSGRYILLHRQMSWQTKIKKDRLLHKVLDTWYSDSHRLSCQSAKQYTRPRTNKLYKKDKNSTSKHAKENCTSDPSTCSHNLQEPSLQDRHKTL